MNLLITGGLGFIGANLVRYFLSQGHIVHIVDFRFLGNWNDLLLEEIKQDYPGNFEFLPLLAGEVSPAILAERKIEAVIHLAAWSHVDDSISKPAEFVKFNVVDHYNFLQSCVAYGKLSKFIYAGTDEVMGQLKEGDPPVTEEVVVRPRNPYSASKAAAESFCWAYHNTFSLPVVIFRSCNVYGPRQHPSKFIPKAILNTLEGKRVPLYGEGKQIREWIFVTDLCEAIDALLQKGKVGQIYNVSSGFESRNFDTLQVIKDFLPDLEIEFVKDRPGHDFRYALDHTKISQELGWKPKISFKEGIRTTILWYKKGQGGKDARNSQELSRGID